VHDKGITLVTSELESSRVTQWLAIGHQHDPSQSTVIIQTWPAGYIMTVLSAQYLATNAAVVTN
jgi:hypothetical protein